jgi:RNA polymerase sigma-70 factor (ECF subfamily)
MESRPNKTAGRDPRDVMLAEWQFGVVARRETMADKDPENAEEQQASAAEIEKTAKAKKKSFWATLPGILAGIAAVLTAVGGLLTALISAGVIGPRDATLTPVPVLELRVVETQPADGADQVDPALSEVVIVFSQPVRTDSWSFVELEGRPFPELRGDPTFRDARTCVLPVKLERGKSYGIGINGPNHKGFVSAADDQLAVEPYVLRLTTAP